MSALTDQGYLKQQYRNAGNLNARIRLHRDYSTNPYPWQRWVFDQFQLPAHAMVLEIGCGPGELWRENAERIGTDWQITLADFSAGMIATNRHNLAPLERSFEHSVADVQALPFATATFDAVIANHMLYHVPNLTQALSEMRRVLRPDGVLFAATNGIDHLRELHELAGSIDPAARFWGGDRNDTFRLENGAQALRPFFEHVSIACFDCNLLVDAAQPLIDFVLSTSAAQVLVDDKLAAFEQLVHERLADGPLHITKATGLFVARRA